MGLGCFGDLRSAGRRGCQCAAVQGLREAILQLGASSWMVLLSASRVQRLGGADCTAGSGPSFVVADAFLCNEALGGEVRDTQAQPRL